MFRTKQYRINSLTTVAGLVHAVSIAAPRNGGLVDNEGLRRLKDRAEKLWIINAGNDEGPFFFEQMKRIEKLLSA